MNGGWLSGQVAWSWLVAAIVLLVLEVMTPGLVFVFFGLAALVMAAVAALWPSMPGAWQTVLFAALSVLFVLALRRTFKRVFTGKKSAVSDNGLSDDFVGHRAVVTEALDGLAPGRVSFNGTSWSAIADEPVAAGTVVDIVAKENLTLTVRRVCSTSKGENHA